ncbi:Putative E3 ubiquitin-protein ligase HERC1 [Durusdinium trenchii]|uniref:E3 ubiquitin-protein ligase HERC1 n=1 Tax=Durusdinium trenchii TaxID=1381693 RepID=A0ABP0N193_9DINO
MKELFVWVVSRPCHVSGYVGLFFWCFLWHDAGENHQVHDTFKLNGTTNMAKRAQPSSAEEYKRILQERQLVSEYTPHILLFCVSLPQLRAFRRQAEQMSQELQELKIDRRYPIKVLPVATLADTQRMEDLEELLKEVKDLAEIVFHKSSAEVEEPAWTMFNPNGDCGNDRGAKEVKARLSKIVYQQIQSPEFRHLWQGAFAEHVAQKTEEHTELFPENDSTLRLFRCAFHTVAAVSGQEVSDRESFNEITQTMVDLPWDIISSIPQNDEIWSMATARGNFLRLWLGLVILAWIGDCYTILLALFMVLMLLPVIYVTILLFTDRQLLWHQVTQCFRRLERLEKVAAETTWPQWSSLWPQTPRDKRKCAFLLLSLLLLGSLHECFMMHEQLEAMAMEVNSEEMATRMAQEQVDRISGKYNYQRSPPAPSCAWDEMRGSCAGLSHLHGVRNVDQCREICCKMGSFCSTWQFSLSEGCRVGQPGVCRVDLFPLWWHPLLGQRK